MEEERAMLRVRVEFVDRHLLSKRQRREGLRRCWLLVRPDFDTVADLADHLSRSFELGRSCPGGLVLCMDGFVLPSFESTCILKDQDTIRVRKKRIRLDKFVENGDNENHIHSLENEKQPITQGDKHLEIKVLQKAGYTGECEGKACDLLEDAIPTGTALSEDRKRKRKRSNKLQGSKKKKLELTSSENQMISIEVAKNLRIDKNQSSFPKRGSLSKSLHKKQKTSNGVGTSDAHIVSQSVASFKKTFDPCSEGERHEKGEENFERTESEHDVDGYTKKIPSRNARRKKSKREWLKKMRKPKINKRQLSENNKHMSHGHQTLEQNTVIVDEIIPSMVQPGHIHFSPTEQEDRQTQREALLWNGTTSKKKEQETPQWNGTTGKNKGQNCGGEKTCWSVGNVCNGDSNKKFNAEEREVLGDPINFENLYPLTRLPEEGDVIAYRIFESSSPLGSELSPYRVGKVLSYDFISMNVVLVPVLEYPIFSGQKRTEGEPILQSNISPYREDGSLEIAYPSLVDVHLFKTNNYEVAAPNKWELASAKESRPNTSWKQIKNGLDEKVSQADGWHGWPKSKPTNTSWHDRVCTWTTTQLGRMDGWNNHPTRPTPTSSAWNNRGSRGRSRGFTSLRGRRGMCACPKWDLF